MPAGLVAAITRFPLHVVERAERGVPEAPVLVETLPAYLRSRRGWSLPAARPRPRSRVVDQGPNTSLPPGFESLSLIVELSLAVVNFLILKVILFTLHPDNQTIHPMKPEETPLLLGGTAAGGAGTGASAPHPALAVVLPSRTWH